MKLAMPVSLSPTLSRKRARGQTNCCANLMIIAKDFATEITIFNAQQNNLTSESAISSEHITNNEAVRNTLLDRGIRPESLPAAEDLKKVERRLASEEKKSLKNPDALDK
ncbi:MAG: hypothetical protein R8K20_04255 [Gallionellaceae bacterium]